MRSLRQPPFVCRAVAILVTGLLLTSTARAEVTFQWAFVGNAGNVNDYTGYGAVGYAYQIGKHEVTNGQYAEFLNAKAASDPLQLYDTRMASGTTMGLGGITRSGAPGGYAYAVISGYANKPVVYVSWYDAVRFANWVNNGHGNADTESGAYTLTGSTPTPANGNGITRNANANVFLPSENEWYKAAYHQPAAAGGDGDDYWKFPTRTNALPVAEPPPGGSNSANFTAGVFAAVGPPYWVSDVGAYTAAGSFYGTFDQAGNVFEFHEGLIPAHGFYRGVRGGSWYQAPIWVGADIRDHPDPRDGLFDVGFRVASVPEPSGPALLGLALLRRRARRTK